jgi:hypothetical protein
LFCFLSSQYSDEVNGTIPTLWTLANSKIPKLLGKSIQSVEQVLSIEINTLVTVIMSLLFVTCLLKLM